MKRWIIVILLALGVGYWLGRRGAQELEEVFFPASPHESYARALAESPIADSPLVERWLRVAATALDSAPRLPAPFHEAGYLDPARPQAVAYRFRIRAGQRLTVRASLEAQRDARLFVDLFRVAGSASGEPEEPVRVESADSGESVLEYEPGRDAVYIVRVQPELLGGGRYELVAELDPTLSFPVGGKDVGSIQSVFGDPRDGGSRSHHGVDIFAPRNTPVLAAAAGRVSRVGTTPRGGHVVWLRDEGRAQSLYYAHLERQLVEAGDRVEPGDTLGLVGNSGNARTTPPHLHFGIYRSGRGPVDPIPFLRPVPPPAAPRVPVPSAGEVRRVAVENGRLRAAPDEDAPVVVEIERDTPLHVIAAVGDWYRVRLPDDRVGFIAGGITDPR